MADRPRSAPPNTPCRTHRDRDALALCPRCEGGACITCWHPSVGLCHGCLRDELESHPPEVPWEAPGMLPMRMLGTFAAAFRPYESAPTLARGPLGPAVVFFLLTVVPLALASGIVPYTHTLAFGPGFVVQTVGSGLDASTIGLDVLRAAGLGLLLEAARVLMVGAPFASLSRAYGEKSSSAVAAPRAILYRAWLLPASRLAFHAALWALPPEPPQLLLFAVLLIEMVPLALLAMTLFASARMGSGAAMLPSFAIVAVPLIGLVVGQLLVEEAIRPLVPDPEVVREAVEAAVTR